MKVAVFSTHEFEKEELSRAARGVHSILWIPEPLSQDTACKASGCDAAIVFANDNADAAALEKLHDLKIRYVTTRSTGYNHIDIAHAKLLGMKVGYVPEYSPFAIAEHAVAMMLFLSRHLKEACTRVSRHDFHMDGLVGSTLHGKTVGIIGLGHTGTATAQILRGFGSTVLGYDIVPKKIAEIKFDVQLVSLEELCRRSDIVSLHVPLNGKTRYMVNKELIAAMQDGVMLINTSRGAVINTAEVFESVKSGKIGSLGIDVYEKEVGIFFQDRSGAPLKDELLTELIAHPRVMVTAHQAFLTKEALRSIAETTFYNLNAWANGFRSKNELT